MKPKQIKILNKDSIYIKWDNDKETNISLKYLRDECPCANCKGETILLKTYRPPKLNISTPEMYQVKNLELVGNYAIKINWKDGHDTGIYSWEYLSQLQEDEEENKSHNYKPLI